MKPIIYLLVDQLDCNLLTFNYSPNKKTNEIREVYSVSLTSSKKLLPLVENLNKYKLIGSKYRDFKDWEKVYYMIISPKHLTHAAYL